MDLKEQVARRRAQIEERERADKAAAQARHVAAEQAGRDAALDALSLELEADGVPVERRDGELRLTPEPPRIVDTEGMKRSALNRLVKREARLLWTPFDNWLVISMISVGVALLHLGGFGLLPLGIGLWRRDALLKRYIAQVIGRYPSLEPG